MALAFLWTNSYLSEISSDLAAIKAAHVDVLFSYLLTPTTPDADMQAYLDALNTAGLKAMLTVRELGKNVVKDRTSKVLTTGELAALTAYVNKWKTHAAVWGWYADDEGTAAQYPVSTRQQVYNTVKAAHPAGQVLEVNFALEAGAYSPAVHDVFALDSYPFYYDAVAAGCVAAATGLVSNLTKAATVLDEFKTTLDERKAELVAAGETNYIVCMQAFGQSLYGISHIAAMPPSSGLWRMWGKVREAGFDGYGAGWFLWKSGDNTMPGEQLIGVGESAYADQRAELEAIAAWPTSFDSEQFGAFELSPPVPVSIEPILPTTQVVVAGQDVTELVDLDTLHRSMSERGEASATIDIPVASENEVPVNGLVRDAVVEISVDGAVEWLGHVVAAHKPKPQDLSYVLDCAGGWDTLHHCAPWCKGFVETRYDLFQVLSVERDPYHTVAGFHKTMIVETDGQLLAIIPRGTTWDSGVGQSIFLQVFDGLVPLNIRRVTFSYVTSGRSMDMACYVRVQPSPYSSVDYVNAGVRFNDAASGTVDWTTSDGILRSTIVFLMEANATPISATAEATFQITELRIYVDRTTAPRVDEIVAAIDAEVRPGAPAPVTEAIGAPLTAFMLDPFMTPAEGIAVALTKAAVPPLCGIIQNQLVIKNRPTTPPDATRLWTVSEQLTPGLEWGVEVDEEQSVDYVGVAYNTIGVTGLPDGTPQIMYWPHQPPNAAERGALIDGGDLTAAEAAFYAQQGYHYLHDFASGPVTIPYVVRDANGAERPADVIRAWDWVQNVGSLDAATAGPFLVSEVEHQGHIATLTIGAAEAYAYNGPDRMPVKGRYVGAHRVRSRTTTRVSFAKYWAWRHRKDKRKPKMPRRHARYGTIRGFKWTDVEGRYQ